LPEIFSSDGQSHFIASSWRPAGLRL
jgi:hypothetical protein